MLVSVYLPTRNRQALLRRAVESVLEQNYRDIELIVVNDASTDGTEEYLKAAAAADSRLRFISNSTPMGACASRNLAIEDSRGEFVTGLDDDDIFTKDRIGAFVEHWALLARCGEAPSCLYSQAVVMHSGGRRIITQKIGSVTAEDLYAQNFVGSQIFAPRSYFIDAGLFDRTMPAWQDLDLIMRLLERHGTARLLDIPTYIYDNSDRPDRISAQARLIKAAFARLVAKKPSMTGRQKQQLMLQMLSRYYGTKASVRDIAQFVGWGFWLVGFARLAKAAIEPYVWIPRRTG